MPAATQKTGVADNAPGAGVAEYLGFSGPLAALLQGCSIVPSGDPWQIKGSASHTPTLITDTLPPHPILGWKVPAGEALLFTGGVYHALAAATEYVRVCRRHFLFGWQATAAPAAPAAPTVATIALTSGLGAGTYSYKVAPIDSFRRESAVTAASANVTPTANQGVTVTPPALPSGAIGYNIYRCTAGNQAAGPWYYVGTTFGATAYIDAQPDASIDTAITPSATWTVGAIAGETMDGPGEVIIEVGAIALTGAPTHIVYTGPLGQTRQAVAVSFPTAIGARLRAKLFGEASNFVAAPTATANLWRGVHGDVRTRHEEDNAAVGVSGVNAGPTAGCFMIWGQQVIGSTSREEATAAIKAKLIEPLNPHGVLIPPLGEIVCEIGALAAGVASVRDVTLQGLLIPTTGT